MPYIYKITNLINGKIYIGKTLDTIEKRWKDHKKDSIRPRCEKRPLYSAMNKYGIENFAIEEVEECSEKELSEREKYWIEFYHSFHDGTKIFYFFKNDPCPVLPMEALGLGKKRNTNS